MTSPAEEPLSEEQRKAIFLALVEAQDKMPVRQSRETIGKRFHLSDRQVRGIETEGLGANWPPLD